MSARLLLHLAFIIAVAFSLSGEASAQPAAPSGSGLGYLPGDRHPYRGDYIIDGSSGNHPPTLAAAWDTDGTPYIAYSGIYQGVHLVTSYAFPGASPCDIGSNWYCLTFDMNAAYGVAVDVFSGTLGAPAHQVKVWRVGVAYTQFTDNTWVIHYSQYGCMGLVCGWNTPTSITTYVHDQTFVAEGYIALRFDPKGVAHIIYHDTGIFGGALVYASYAGSSGNCGSNNAWNCVVIIDNASGYTPDAIYPSLEFDNTGNAQLTAYDQGTEWLVYAKYYVSSNLWDLSIIANSAKASSIHVRQGANDLPRIAYVADSGILNFAQYVGRNNPWANCGTDINGQHPAWSCSAITMSAKTPGLLSLEVDEAGAPVIAYTDTYSTSESLKVVFNSSIEGKVPGNCGPSLNWHCEFIMPDPTGQWWNAGNNVIHFNPVTGMATIVFFEETGGDNVLYFATQFRGYPVFLPNVEK